MTTYYGLNEQLLFAANALRQYYKVIDYPLLKFSKDKFDKKSNYVDDFIEFINNNNVDVILWWYITIPTNEFIKITQGRSNLKNIFFNWDEPFNWSLNDLENKAKYLDAAFITCEETTVNYINNGTKHAEYCLPGYNEGTHFIILDDSDPEFDKYEADISFICTNLYTDSIYSQQLIKRKEIVDNIYANMDKYNYVFKIYGPEFLKSLYPKAYNGFVHYRDTNKIFNKSKINLCTHVIGNKNKYINERVILIGGSGGLLLVDPILGIDKVFNPDDEIVLMDKDNYVEQIYDILCNYEKYIDRRMNFHKKSKNYTWNKWGEQIHNYLKKK